MKTTLRKVMWYAFVAVLAASAAIDASKAQTTFPPMGGQGGALVEITTVLSSAQVLALDATPVVLLPAEAGAAFMPWAISVHKPAGTAYADIAVGDDILLETTTSTLYFTVETIGLLDQATAQGQVSRFGAGTLNTALLDVGIRLRLAGPVTTGNSPLTVKLVYWRADSATP